MKLINKTSSKEISVGDVIIDGENYYMIVKYEDYYYALDLTTLEIDDYSAFDYPFQVANYIGHTAVVVPKDRLSLTLE